jgi:TRAP transporter 4TM/12TM fusion protein
MESNIRLLSRPYVVLVALLAILIAVAELGFQMGFNFYLYNLLTKLGLDLPWLRTTLDTQQVQALVLALSLAIVFIAYPLRKKEREKVPLYDLALAFLGFAAFFYVVVVFPELVYRVGRPTMLDIAMGILAIALLIEATRRTLGPVLPLVALAFLTYGMIYGIEAYSHVENPLARATTALVNHLYLAKEGIFGTPLFVMVTYVYAFVLFGAFLEKLGVGAYVMQLVLSLLGKKPGGPAKVAVVSSGLVGTSSGSSVANVMVTGTFTIPMMKRSGFPPHLAGAVEAAASTGGQLMPPLMGAAAFVMAEFLGRPYRDIIIAGFIPALLYYIGVYIFIDLYTKRLGIKPIEEKFPPLLRLMRSLYLLLPIPLIAYLLVVGIPPQHSAIAALTLTVVTGLVAQPSVSWTVKITTIAGIALLAVAIIFAGLNPYAAVITLGVLTIVIGVVLGLLLRGGRSFAAVIYKAVTSTSTTATTVFLAASMAGIVQGVLTYTGQITAIGFKLLELAGGNLLLLLLMTMSISLVLGMGVPTTANYIITSLVSASAIASAARELGYAPDVALLMAHMFVFYFGILADVTPPVALAAYAASTIAKSDYFKTGLYAGMLALAGYLGPYMFAFHPDLLLVTVKNWDATTAVGILINFASGVVGMYSLAAGVTGYLRRPLPRYLRALLIPLGAVNVVVNPLQNPAVLLATIAALTFAALKK